LQKVSADNLSFNAESFEVVEQRSTSILMRWNGQHGKMYMVKATYGNLALDSCDEGIDVVDSFVSSLLFFRCIVKKIRTNY